jgi:ribosomal protein L22
MPVPRRPKKRKEDPEKADVAPEETPDAEVEDAGGAEESETAPTPEAEVKDAAEGAEETGDDEAKAAAEAKARAKEASRPKRRGAAETSTRREPTRPVPRREGDGAIQVRAKARYVRSAPRKARLVMDHIRGKRVEDARAILRHTPRAAATDISKLLESAIANAENNFELDPDDLKIDRAFVDEGPTIKRFRPRALGRATPIHKRTSHMTITLTTEEKR